MYYSDMLKIQNGMPDTFFGILAIITLVVLIYTFGFSELTRKKIAKLKEAKRTAVDGLTLQKMKAEVMEEAEDIYGQLPIT